MKKEDLAGANFTAFAAALTGDNGGSARQWHSLEEIRLRVGQPFMLHSGQGEVWLGHSGPVVS